jgi:hypothetical protein
MSDNPRRQPNRYSQIIEHIFFEQYKDGVTRIAFVREDFQRVAQQLQLALPKNLGDVIYSFRYRTALPDAIRATAPPGQAWIIRPEGRSVYAFELVADLPITPNTLLSQTKIPDATPGIVTQYAFGDEQALLTRIRYNRLIDLFSGVTCYSLQNHLRTTVPGMGQVETDEVYVGMDRRGAHYVFPVQAKGGSDRLHIVQIEQDIALCKHRFPLLICRAIGAQFLNRDLIVLFEFEMGDNGLTIAAERHYRLVLPSELTEEDLRLYQQRPLDTT